MNSVVIVAAGNGTRMKSDINKQFICLNDIPVIIHTLRIFDSIHEIDNIVVVTRRQDLSEMNNIVRSYQIDKILRVTEGGATRQQSVLCGLRSLSAHRPDNVLIHDGARPFVAKAQILQMLRLLNSGCTAVTAAVPPKDTIMRAGADGVIKEAYPRDELVSIQTPQGFRYSSILDAHIKAEADGAEFTDDCGVLMAYSNDKIITVEGSYNNIKITTPEDITLADRIISQN